MNDTQLEGVGREDLIWALLRGRKVITIPGLGKSFRIEVITRLPQGRTRGKPAYWHIQTSDESIQYIFLDTARRQAAIWKSVGSFWVVDYDHPVMKAAMAA